MIRTTKWLLLLIALLLSPLFARVAGAQTTYNAASCSESAVQSAYATEQGSKADGDIISIPACSATTWSSAWSISPTNSLTIQGQSTTSGTCAPGGTCTATDNTNITLGASLTINTAAGKSFRMTGMSFTVSFGPAYGAINFKGASTAVRGDHNHFTDNTVGDHTIQVDGIRGVFDHNYLQTPNGENINFFQITNYGTDGMADAIWTVPDNFGSSDYVFIENNYFVGSFVYDCDFGGKIVLRYNIAWYGTQIQTHGVGSGAQVRGCRSVETYGDTFTYSANPSATNFAFLVDYESGTGMWWNITTTGFLAFLREDEIRANTDTYGAQTSTPNGWGMCGSGSTGTGSAWDSSTSGTGYPCLDQIGRGAGQLISGSFPSKVNSSTGTIAWPHQALVPVYAWDNTLNQVPQERTISYWDNYESPATAVENRDYYLQLPNAQESATFNGTAGIGQGPLASKPSSCTPSVGWWATDQGNWNQSGNGAGNGVLYVCSATNTWTASYTPYTYPHPLVSGGGTTVTSPAAPTNLAASVN
jgi:hypothetical protein